MSAITNIFKVKSIMTLMVFATLCFLVITNPASENYSTAFVGIASSVTTYYFTKQHRGEEDG